MTRKLLVVEDNTDDQVLILHVLKGKYEDIEVVGSLSAARESMSKRQPDAVILDINLPDAVGKMDALDTIKKIKSDHAMILILTGLMTTELAEKWISGNASGCVSKDRMSNLPHEIEAGIKTHRAQVSGENARNALTNP